MKLYLTKNFDGDVVETLCEANTQEEVMSFFETWKINEAHKQNPRFRICPYAIFTNVPDGTVIDFGDYTWFCKTSPHIV